ncbi:uncharacterized protein L969DRAFT_177927 [Mixia osmundae IAM 14324]|nr:uncharacterized protein L969DRAFT_177927 [Mixia osmundae IAM 14324]KEI42838.1 hypothetical protein L969DRAFT_177927 [Mixia osmundae IAM 14324]
MATAGDIAGAIITGLVFFGILIAVYIATTKSKEALAATKKDLKAKGYDVHSNTLAVRTDKRALTKEETQDAMQAGMMKGWKASTFNVPGIMQPVLGGTAHDKNKAEYDAKHAKKSR